MLSDDCMNAQGGTAIKAESGFVVSMSWEKTLRDLRSDSQGAVPFEVVMECSRIHMLMTAYKYTDPI